LASADPGAAAAARTAAATIHRKARARLKLAKKPTGWAEIVICFLFFYGAAARRQLMCQATRFHGSSLPIRLRSAISAAFIARLIKGCRGDDPAGCFT
jgi:hypothetical protein